MDRVVIISNRVMLPNLEKKESTGGLAVALLEGVAHSTRAGRSTLACSPPRPAHSRLPASVPARLLL